MKVETLSSFSSPSVEKEENSKSFNTNYDLQYFVNLDSENKICFDCGGPYPTYVSINNGVFICSNCAQNHEKLGYNISYLQKISSPWDPYLLSYATRGGNTRFKRLCLQYEVPCQSYNENNEEKLNKYIIRLGEYNRLVLRSEVLADEPPKTLYLEVAKDPCNLNIIYFPEFQNYHLYLGEVVVPGKSYSIGGKIWNGTKATASAVGTAGGLVYKVGKPVVCFLGGTAFKGIKYMGSSLWNHYMGSDKDNKKENGTDFNNSNNLQNNINGNNSGRNQNMNNFAIVDYSNEDLCQVKTIDLNSPKDIGSMNVNYNFNNNNYINSNGNNINNNKYNIYTIDGNNSNHKMNYNNNMNNNIQFGKMNMHNNIISNDNYLMNNNQEINNININSINVNRQTFDLPSNENNINLNNNSNFGGFEIVSPNYNQDKEYNNSSNCLFENNSFAGMNVQFENTDKDKARKDANNFLLKS